MYICTCLWYVSRSKRNYLEEALSGKLQAETAKSDGYQIRSTYNTAMLYDPKPGAKKSRCEYHGKRV